MVVAEGPHPEAAHDDVLQYVAAGHSGVDHYSVDEPSRLPGS